MDTILSNILCILGTYLREEASALVRDGLLSSPWSSDII
jgi:hypothetical protein